MNGLLTSMITGQLERTLDPTYRCEHSYSTTKDISPATPRLTFQDVRIIWCRLRHQKTMRVLLCDDLQIALLFLLAATFRHPSLPCSR